MDYGVLNMSNIYLIAGVIATIGFVICVSLGIIHLCMKNYPATIICGICAVTEFLLSNYYLARYLS